MSTFTTFKESLRSRSDLHLGRRVWHMLFGCAFALAYILIFSQRQMLFILAGMFMTAIVVELLRFSFPKLNEGGLKWFKWVVRANEVHRLHSAVFFIASGLVVIACFPKIIALLGILYLAFGDPIASLVGILWGRYAPKLFNGKSLLGTLACFVVCSLITLIVTASFGLSAMQIVALTFIGGSVGAAAELIPLKLDDNLTIPILSALALRVTFPCLGM